MNLKKRTLLCFFSAFAIFGNACALYYVKIMPKINSVEGRIVLASKPDKKPAALYLVKDKVLCQIPNTEMSGKIAYPHWSPEGDRIAFYAYNGENEKTQGIYIIKENGNDLKFIQEGIISSFNFYEGMFIFNRYTGDARINDYNIMDLLNGKVRKLSEHEIKSLTNSSYWIDNYSKISPNGKKKLWYKISSEQASPNELYMTDLGTGEITLIAKGSSQVDIQNAVWSSDSKKIMYLRESIFDNQQIKVYNLETRETIVLIKFGSRYIEGFDWWTPSVK